MKEKQKRCLEAGTGLQGLCRWASCGSRLGPPVAMIVGLGVGLVSCRGAQPSCFTDVGQQLSRNFGQREGDRLVN